jgi:hypothetical protein
MKRIFGATVALAILAVFLSSAQAAIKIEIAEVQNGFAFIKGNGAQKSAQITWDGNAVTTANNQNGGFSFNGAVPNDCIGTLGDGTSTIEVAVLDCTQATLPLLATGQTTAFKANKDDGIALFVPVNDDGTFQLGIPLQYKDNGDGTVTDLNTGLMWEKKVPGSGCLHCVDEQYIRWYVTVEDGSQESIWDWLDDLNASNFAGHSDWRIPNVRELHSIVHYGFSSPSIDPIFGPTQNGPYWSSTTAAYANNNDAFYVDFYAGGVGSDFKIDGNYVRAVRGP